MRKLIYFVACSLDGFIAHSDGSHTGFSDDGEYLNQLFVEFPETLPTHFRKAMGITAENRHFDTVLMGRKTYEVGLKEGFNNPYDHLRQYVFSRSLGVSPHPAVTLVTADAIACVEALKNEVGKDIWLCGGGNLASFLLSAGLIDSLILKVNPFIMGTGIALFGPEIPRNSGKLRHSQLYPANIILLHYEFLSNSAK